MSVDLKEPTVMKLDRLSTVIEHARKLPDAADPTGRARSLERLAALACGTPEGTLDRLADVLLDEIPAFGDALRADGRSIDRGQPGVGLSLLVLAGAHRDPAVRISLCALYAEAVRAAREPSARGSLEGVGNLAAERLRQRLGAFRASLLPDAVQDSRAA